MNEFTPILDAKKTCKGSIKGTIIKMSELKSGTTKAGSDWTRKDCVIEDKSDSVKFTIWGEDISKFKLGYVYEIVNPQWKNHEGTIQVQPSKYGTYTCVGVAETQEAIVEASEPTPPPTAETKKSVPALESSIEQTIGANTILMVQIETKVRAVLKDLFGKSPDNAQVGLYTKMNFYFLKGMDAKD